MLIKDFSSNKLILMAFAIGLIIFGSRLHLIELFAVSTPYWDDWGLASMLNRYANGALELPDIFRAYNEHRLVFNKLLTLIIFDLNQEQWDPMISMVLNALIWTITGVFLIRIVSKHKIFSVIWPVTILFFWVFPISLVNLLWGVQTHNYMMILFSVLGCWLVGGVSYSKSWWLGMFCLLAACFTMAGGVFLAISVATVYGLASIFHSGDRKQYITISLLAIIVSTAGVYLIFTQNATDIGSVNIDFIDASITFLRAMSWPLSLYAWPSIVLFVPIATLGFISLRNENIFSSKLTRFTLCLYGFVILISIAIAFARDAGGAGPSRRYIEFLALAPIASLLSLMLILQLKNIRSSFWRVWLPTLWVTIILLSIPNLLYIVDYTINDREQIKPLQEIAVKNFLSSEDPIHFQQKAFRVVPFPNPEMFETALIKYKKSDILPYQLQIPKPLEHNPEQSRATISKSPFIENGTVFPSKSITGGDLYGETVIGSYRPSMGGMTAIGGFKSLEFHLTRDYMMIPVIGYLGYKGLSLKLEEIFTHKEYEITPKIDEPRNAEAWQEIVMKVPKGYYRLIAQDQNEELWFGFAAPRTVGKLSYWNKKLIENGHYIWKFGFILLLLLSRKTISRWFYGQSNSDFNEVS